MRIDLSNRPVTKLVGKVAYALESIFSDRPTVNESFDDFSYVTLLSGQTYAPSRLMTCSIADRYTFFSSLFNKFISDRIFRDF